MQDIKQIRDYFPILSLKINGKDLIYLDNAATTQKPLPVVDALRNFYLLNNANVGRGIYALAEQASAAYAKVREQVQAFLHAKESSEIIFVPGSTFAINLVASSFGRSMVQKGDRILISTMEHHSNLLPWQMLCEEKEAYLDVIPITDDGELELDQYAKLLTPRTKIVAISHVSNVLGTISPLAHLIKLAHAQNIPVLVDGAQAIAHMPIDVQELDCDFYVFSGHKMYAPTGCGVLYGKRAFLEKMPPYQGGGGMIKSVSFAKSTYADIPEKFEAGTPDIGGVIGLGAAITFIQTIGIEKIMQHEHELLMYATVQLQQVEKLKIIGNAAQKTGVISFVFPQIHPHDIATILDSEGIAVRAGHHCAMPLMQRLNVPATTRASFAMYNTKDEIDALVVALNKSCDIFAGC